MISHKHKIIFVPIPKNASCSIAFLINGGKSDYGHSTAKDLMRKHGEHWDDYYKFCVVRNPYDRIVSTYHHFKTKQFKRDVKGSNQRRMQNLLKQYSGFQDFVLNYLKDAELVQFRFVSGADISISPTVHFYPQIMWLLNSNGKINDDIDIFKFEKLDEVVQKLTTEYDMSNEFGHLNKGKRNHYSEYYTDELYEVIYKKYQKDFELLGYDR
jgi:hypothetical protein